MKKVKYLSLALAIVVAIISGGCGSGSSSSTPQYSLTTSVGPSGGGSVTVSPIQATYTAGQQVTLTATPNAGYYFGNWSGDASGTTNPRTITITGNMSVTANFTAIQYTLSMSASPAGGGTVAATPGPYTYGQQVTLTANPYAGYTFSGWSGDASGTTNPTTITITGNASVTANYTAIHYTLTTGASPSGGGSIIASPSQATYTYGQQVTLTAAPNAGYTFSNWSGATSDSTNPRTITITANTSITANFTLSPYSLTASASPSGGGSITVNPSQGPYTYGQQITLTATPNAGYTFSNWSGGTTGTTNPRTITITGDTAVTANFTAIQYSLTTGTSPSVGGSVTLSPSQATYTYSQQITLTATPSAGYTFSNWSEGASGTTNPRTIIITDNVSVTANFTAIQYSLTTGASPAGGGLVSLSPSQATYTYDQQVTLTATPNAGYTFSSWSGGGTTNPRTITITGNASVTANFTAIQYTLSTSVTPSVGGSITLSPSQATYTYGQQVTLTAVPNNGYTFSNWGGGASGTTNPSTITITNNTTVSANFSTPLHTKLLVVAPHPDDDIVMASGIVYRAVERGDEVRVVYMTNGDYYASVYNGVSYNGIQTGLIRESEGVAGQSILGVPENELMFLGYPDGYLQTIYQSNPNDVYTTPNNNQSTTYGNHGLGLTDYHNYRFGAHASYTRVNILTDLQDIISSYQPDHILVTSEFDNTTDHATTYNFVRLATTAVCNNNLGYNPVIHKTIIWWNPIYWWPNLPIVWPNVPDPTAYLAEIPNVDATGLLWSNRESFDVPLPMQLSNYADNPKALALNTHIIGQKGVYGYIGFFLHKDEVFWPENVAGTNHPPVVNAGSDHAVAQGAIVTLDGSRSMDPDSDPLTYQWVQRSGPAVALSNPTSATPYFTAPSGLSQDEVLTFELVVSDGHFVTLPDSVSVRVLTRQAYTTNIASLATVTASSESAQYGQTAVKAVDGVVDGYLGNGALQVDGYPGDGTREWSSNGETTGAWLQLAWSSPHSVDRIVLHDRINLADDITSATITFSDGSSIVVGPLNNNGTSTEYTFSPKTISSLTMTVTGVSSTTSNSGLAEIEVYGQP